MTDFVFQRKLSILRTKIHPLAAKLSHVGLKRCPHRYEISPWSKQNYAFLGVNFRLSEKLIAVCYQKNICYVTDVNCALVRKNDALSGITFLFIWSDTSLFIFLNKITPSSGKNTPSKGNFTILGTRSQIAPFMGKNTLFWDEILNCIDIYALLA